MNSEIVKAALDGARITVESDCWPLRCKAGGIRISMTKQTWNGVRTLNRTVKADELTGGETLDGRDLTYTSKQEATEGHILITFSFEVKSISKTTLDIGYIFERFDVDYNDGYLFENSELFVDLKNKWKPVNGLLDAEIEPLDSTVYEFRGYLEVPEEVVSNTDSSLNLNVYLDGHMHGRTIPDFIFNIR